MTTGYKVVSFNNLNEYFSVLSSTRTKYKVGIPTIRSLRCGPLTLFDSLENAHRFVSPRHTTAFSMSIFECEYTQSTSKSLWIHHTRPDWVEEMTHNFPLGTLFADSITLTNKVENWR